MVFEVDARSDEPLPGAVQVEFSKALHQEKGEADDDTLLNSTAFACANPTAPSVPFFVPLSRFAQ